MKTMSLETLELQSGVGGKMLTLWEAGGPQDSRLPFQPLSRAHAQTGGWAELLPHLSSSRSLAFAERRERINIGCTSVIFHSSSLLHSQLFCTFLLTPNTPVTLILEPGQNLPSESVFSAPGLSNHLWPIKTPELHTFQAISVLLGPWLVNVINLTHATISMGENGFKC